MSTAASPVDLRPDHLGIVRDILRRHVPDRKVLAFGSRATWTAKEYSDLDLAILGEEPLSLGVTAAMADDFSESDLPFKVDIVDWARLDESFRDIVRRDQVTVQSQTRDSERLAAVDAWTETTIREAFKINPSRSIKRGDIVPFIPMDALPVHCRALGNFENREFTGSGTRFQNGDTLIARITPCLENGKTVFVSELPQGVVAYGSTEYIVLTGREGISDRLFAYYLAREPAFRHYAVSQMEGTSGRQRVPSRAVEEYGIYLPPLVEQRTIAHILGTLDDKIELNRRMNETLEATARSIFKDWFVDFGPTRAKMEGRAPYLPSEIWTLFPDALDDQGKPREWRVGTLDEVADAPRRNVSPANFAEDTPYIGLEHMPRRSIALTEWEGAGKVTSNKSIFKKGEFLFGKLRPYFHKVGIAPLDGICSTDIVVVTPREPYWAVFTLACLSSDAFVDYTSQTSTGTRMPRTNWKTMGQYEFCLPPDQVVRAFQDLVQSLLNRIDANIHENRVLAQLRDILLPDLMSGRVRLDDTSAPECMSMLNSREGAL